VKKFGVELGNKLGEGFSAAVFGSLDKYLVVRYDQLLARAQVWIDECSKWFARALTAITSFYLVWKAYNWITGSNTQFSSEAINNPVKLNDESLFVPEFGEQKLQGIHDPKAITWPVANLTQAFVNKSSGGTTVDSVDKINKQVVKFTTPSGEDVAYGLAINNSWIMMNQHSLTVVEKYGWKCSFVDDLNGQRQPIVFQNQGKPVAGVRADLDLMFVRVGIMPFVRDIRKFFSSTEVGPKICTLDVFGERMPGKFQSTLIENLQISLTGYVYGKSRPGFCGKPIFAIQKTPAGVDTVYIAGVHSAGRDELGCAVYINQRVLDPYVPVAGPMKSESVATDLCEVSPMNGFMKGDDFAKPYFPIGSMGKNSQGLSKSRLVRTEYHDQLIDLFNEKKVIPDLHIKGKVVDGEWFDPKTPKKKAFDILPLNADLYEMDLALKDLCDHGLEVPQRGPLCFEQACNGVDGDSFMKAMNLSTSSGAAKPFYGAKKNIVDREL
jgi:hypothetical protein